MANPFGHEFYLFQNRATYGQLRPLPSVQQAELTFNAGINA
jgi:hypothetical protein